MPVIFSCNIPTYKRSMLLFLWYILLQDKSDDYLLTTYAVVSFNETSEATIDDKDTPDAGEVSHDIIIGNNVILENNTKTWDTSK